MDTDTCRILCWPGIKVVEDAADARNNPGIETLEGRIGPLLKGVSCQVHFIEMPGGLYCAEHPHQTESLIFTFKGRWVLCSQGRRQLMNPGSLSWFKAGIPTGYEVPFDEPAFILIFKGAKDHMSDQAFLKYLEEMNASLLARQSKGEAFLLHDLPHNHPAREYAYTCGWNAAGDGGEP